MKTLHEQIMEEICNNPDAFCEKVIGLVSASKALLEEYPKTQNSGGTLLAWVKLAAAAYRIEPPSD